MITGEAAKSGRRQQRKQREQQVAGSKQRKQQVAGGHPHHRGELPHRRRAGPPPCAGQEEPSIEVEGSMRDEHPPAVGARKRAQAESGSPCLVAGPGAGEHHHGGRLELHQKGVEGRDGRHVFRRHQWPTAKRDATASSSSSSSLCSRGSQPSDRRGMPATCKFILPMSAAVE